MAAFIYTIILHLLVFLVRKVEGNYIINQLPELRCVCVLGGMVWAVLLTISHNVYSSQHT